MSDLKPMPDKEDGTCSPDCPFLQPWDHPYYHHSAWCWKQGKDLFWYDYWQADCIDHNPDEKIVNFLASGRTVAPQLKEKTND